MKTATFLTFVGDQCGKAEEAIQFYTSIFPNSEITSIAKYQEGEAGGAPELVKHAVFVLNGTEYMISENNFNHGWTITPGVSIFVNCDTEKEMQTLFEKLSSNGGQIMIPLSDYSSDNYGLGKKFGWCADKFGVSWQFNLSE